MRILVALLVLLLALPVFAQTPKPKAGAAKTPAAASPAPKKQPAPTKPGRDLSASLSLAERVSIQFDLAWTGDYNGLIDGEFTDKTIAAVKSFQKDRKFKETGTLAPAERAALAAASKVLQDHVGWRMVDDKATGAQIGLPTTQVPNTGPGKSGTRWFSAQGQIQVETFRIREPGTKLSDVFEQQKKEPPGRRLEVNFLKSDFFILSGMQGLKKFYVRAEIRDGEVRGMTVLYDQATDGIMDPVVVAMSSAFAPFPGTGIAALIGPPPRRKVEYGTGIVVTAAGHILTDRQLIDGCNVVEIGGFGDADRLAEDTANDLALLRIYNAPALTPAALVHEGAKAGDLTLVGIADPQAQAGGNLVSTATAHLDADTVAPTPPAGFAGAAALDSQGRLYGMIELKNPMIATVGAATPSARASIMPLPAIRSFLDAQHVAPATGRPGADAAKAALVRVICVRR